MRVELRRTANYARVPANPAPSLRAIQSVVQEDLQKFRQYFRSSVQTEHTLLNLVLRFLFRRQGKQIRPTLVLLCAKACGGVTEQSYRAAALLELVHTTTLLHDDVVDESELRRGMHSVNALWGNKVAVLLGDFLLSRGLHLATTHADYEILKALSHTVQRMSEGELLQIKKKRFMDIDEEVYYRIIADKTASLLSESTRCGAYSARADAATTERFRQFGEHLGLAFQIRDDLFDFESFDIGKPVGADLDMRLVTLPLIHALNQAGRTERRRILRIVRQRRKRKADRQRVRDFVANYGGLAHARLRMESHLDQALALLDISPPSPARHALATLSRFIITRNR
ncbi:MAG: polyprenyl synthetase family protein [Bacteroidota bacterium]|nr:polyprenyl synthetase family protein [Bacteroidota bacterium]